jgi:hypothetical protein
MECLIIIIKLMFNNMIINQNLTSTLTQLPHHNLMRSLITAAFPCPSHSISSFLSFNFMNEPLNMRLQLTGAIAIPKLKLKVLLKQRIHSIVQQLRRNITILLLIRKHCVNNSSSKCLMLQTQYLRNQLSSVLIYKLQIITIVDIILMLQHPH